MEPTPKPLAETEETLAADGQGETTMEALLKGEAELTEKLSTRQVTLVRVIQVTAEKVLVDIGEKHEGVVPVSDFLLDGAPAVGEEIAVVLEKKGRGDEPALLSAKKARAQLGWDTLKTAHAANERVKGRVTQWIKGGYRVDVEGVEAFMPLSQSELRTPPRHRLPVGAKIRCNIIEMHDERRQAVVSRRKVLEEEEGKRRSELLGQIKPGQTHRGWISHVTDLGVFVNLGGLEGLVHTADIDWKDQEKAKASYTRGQRVSVKVLSIEEGTGKVSLGLKQLKSNPADLLKKKFPPKTIVKAKITAVTPAGASALVGSVPAWIGAEELPTDAPPKEGDNLQAVVLGVRFSEFDLNLSAKRYEDIEDRKKMQKYLRKAPPLTLGQLLNAAVEEQG